MAPAPQNIRFIPNLPQMRSMVFRMVRQHSLSLGKFGSGRDTEVDGRLLQTNTLPQWFPDRDECYIEFCNHYESLRKSICCPAGVRQEFHSDGVSYCTEATTCSAAAKVQVESCKLEAMHQTLPLKRHIFSPSCGGISGTNSTVHHNGTHFVREVRATWKCVFPEGTCFGNHAPLEGLPDKMQDCITEENEGPLTVKFVIDLHCAHMDQNIQCDSNLNTKEFDPFHTCTNDPNLLKAKCHLGCTNGYPKEYCTFEFDSIGAFNMSDRTIDTCSLQAECMSPYVEANSMFCSSHQGQSHYKPHWESRPLPSRDVANHGIRGPPPKLQTELPRSRLLSLVLWLIALIAFGVGVLFLALRVGVLPEGMKDHIEGIIFYFRGAPEVRNFGTPYRAPSVRPGRSQYVAPSPASSPAEHGTDVELDRI